MPEFETEIEGIKASLEKLREQFELVGKFALRTSFEMGANGDAPLETVQCPVCLKDIERPYRHIRVSEDFWHTGEIKRIECPHCDVVFGPLSAINKKPERLSSDYELLYSVYAEGATTEYQKRAFLALAPEKENRYLNFACGNWAQGCSELAELGWKVFGYEPHLPYQHPQIVRHMSELDTSGFDGIFTHNFIEHLQDPIAQFKNWNAMLKIGDRMVHSSPCFEWLYDFSNFHLFFLLGRSLSLLAEQTGFEIVNQIDFELGNRSLFTRLVVFRKVQECTGIKQNSSDSSNLKNHQNDRGNMQNIPVGKFYGQFNPPVDRFIFERYFPDTNIQGVFVECGAFDGLTECSCKFFEETMGWTGFNFEPVPWLFESLTKNRPLSKNLNLALSDRSGEATFKHAISPLVGRDFGNGSLNHQPSHLELLEQGGCTFQNINVTTITWNEFVDREHLTNVDLFVLDVEGHELEVIEGMRNSAVLPKIMCVEYGHIGIDTIRNAMSSLGYEYDITSHGNAYFVRKDVLGLFALRRANPATLYMQEPLTPKENSIAPHKQELLAPNADPVAPRGQGPLVFIHIPKCSGTSFEHYLQSCTQISGRGSCYTGFNPQGGSEDYQNYALRNANSPFIYGHSPYALYKQHFPDAFFLTFLRDPVQRTISQYRSWHDPKNFHPGDMHYIRATAKTKEALTLAQNSTLEQFVKSDNPHILANALGNLQTLMLSSLKGVSLDEHLESAKRNLENFVFFGLTERFNESISLFRSVFSDAPEYALAHSSENRSRIKVDKISDSVMDTIRSQVSHDLALYEFATALFEKKINTEPQNEPRYLLSELFPQSGNADESLQADNDHLGLRVKELSDARADSVAPRAQEPPKPEAGPEDAPFMQKPLAFIHIPKCSGTSFEHYLKSCVHVFGYEKCYTGVNPQGDLEDFFTYALRNADSPLVYGHTPYALYMQHFPDALFLTFLRDPVQRTISQYKSWHDPLNFHPADHNFIRASAEATEALTFVQNATLEQFIKTDIPYIANIIGNRQTLMLSSLKGVSLDEHLESAKRNLESFVFFGLTERFDESISLFRSVFPDAPEYALAHSSENRSRVKVDTIPDSLIDAIKEQVSHDLSLYEFATALFEKRINTEPQNGSRYLLSELFPRNSESVQTEVEYLNLRVKELSDLYAEITQSRAWRVIEKLRTALKILKVK